MATNRVFISSEHHQGDYDVKDIHAMSCLTYFTMMGVGIVELFPLIKHDIINSIKERSNGELRVGVRTKYITEIK